MREGVASDGFRGEAIKSATQGTGPSPLLLLAVGVVVSPTILATRQQMPG